MPLLMYWGFDTKNINKKVRPQDDFYHYANGGWIKKTKIPKDEARWGAFVTLRYKTEHQLKKIVADCLATPTLKKASGLVSGYYRAAADMTLRNKLGIEPIEGLRKKIHELQTKEQLLECLAYLHVLGISGFWGAFVDQDSKNSSQYILHLWQSGLGMPDRDYYTEGKPEQKRVREAYVVHIEKLMQLAGKTTAEAKHAREVVMEVETRLAKASMKKEDTRDAEKTYHKKSLQELQTLSPVIHWKKYFAQTGAEKATRVIVGQPEFFTFVSRLITDTPLSDLKTYLEWHLINSSASLLSQKFVQENFNFYVTTLTGTKRIKPLWRRALAATNGALGDALGKLYVEKYFPASSKRAMDALVDDLFDAYAARIKQLNWMSKATKRKALVKLRAMNRKIGYPKKWKSYKGLAVKADDYFGNVLRSETYEHHRTMRKLGRPIDRAEWHMSPQTVNAYFSATLNDIVFPAAILQWPFFDPRADDAVNYAGIGSVIGHEITHGFDDQGAKFDSKGNMRTWWTKEDVKRFTKKTKPFIAQANKEITADAVHINGTLTLGENMADSGGLIIAYDAYQKHLHKSGRKQVAGVSSEQRFFLGFAQMEREISRPEVKKMYALTDPHAAAHWRINGPLSNFEPFYKAFGVKKSHKLYRAPKTRAQIW
ncbi:MAG: M13 family metallopeptidase [bacterium]|nr:M13 family metallopeptidase [bacterium]